MATENKSADAQEKDTSTLKDSCPKDCGQFCSGETWTAKSCFGCGSKCCKECPKQGCWQGTQTCWRNTVKVCTGCGRCLKSAHNTVQLQNEMAKDEKSEAGILASMHKFEMSLTNLKANTDATTTKYGKMFAKYIQISELDEMDELTSKVEEMVFTAAFRTLVEGAKLGDKAGPFAASLEFAKQGGAQATINQWFDKALSAAAKELLDGMKNIEAKGTDLFTTKNQDYSTLKNDFNFDAAGYGSKLNTWRDKAIENLEKCRDGLSQTQITLDHRQNFGKLIDLIEKISKAVGCLQMETDSLHTCEFVSAATRLMLSKQSTDTIKDVFGDASRHKVKKALDNLAKLKENGLDWTDDKILETSLSDAAAEDAKVETSLSDAAAEDAKKLETMFLASGLPEAIRNKVVNSTMMFAYAMNPENQDKWSDIIQGRKFDENTLKKGGNNNGFKDDAGEAIDAITEDSQVTMFQLLFTVRAKHLAFNSPDDVDLQSLGLTHTSLNLVKAFWRMLELDENGGDDSKWRAMFGVETACCAYCRGWFMDWSWKCCKQCWTECDCNFDAGDRFSAIGAGGGALLVAPLMLMLLFVSFFTGHKRLTLPVAARGNSFGAAFAVVFVVFVAVIAVYRARMRKSVACKVVLLEKPTNEQELV